MRQSLLTYLTIIGLTVLLTVLGMRYWISPAPDTTRTSATVLLERVQKVAKLVAVEGYFTEMYAHEEYWKGYEYSAFKKKALIRVQAKVSMGFDIESMQFNVDERTHTLEMSALPDPQVLSIDHELDYYDLQEGLFNSFSERDLTDLNRRAKELIEQEALKSDLKELATNQGEDLLGIIETMAKTMGYQVKSIPVVETPQ